MSPEFELDAFISALQGIGLNISSAKKDKGIVVLSWVLLGIVVCPKERVIVFAGSLAST